MIWEEIYMKRAFLYTRQRAINEIALEIMNDEYLSKKFVLLEYSTIQNEYNAIQDELQMLNLLEQALIILGHE